MELWANGPRPGPSFTAMVFEPCGRVLGTELCRTNVRCTRKVGKKQKKTKKKKKEERRKKKEERRKKKKKKKEKNTIERKKQEARSKRQKKEGAGASCRSFSSRRLELVSSRFRK